MNASEPLDNSPRTPLITVGMTCFNAAGTIADAIESARAQDWPNVEIIVVDDASTDESPSIIEDFSRRDDRIRWIRHDRNRGYAAALNSIVEAARGEIVALFDDDDVSVPDRLTKQWHRITDFESSTTSSIIMCYADRDVVDSRNQEPRRYVTAIGRSPTEPGGTDVVDFLLWHYERPGCAWGQFGSCTLMARLETLRTVGQFDENFRRAAEWDLAIRAGFLGGHFIAVGEPLITQYITTGEDKGGTLPLESMLKLRQKYKRYLEKKRVYRASVAIAYARFHYARQNRVLSLAYLGAACLLSPTAVLPNEWRKWWWRKRGGQ